MLKTGEELFLVQCVACHGSSGSGVVGPDLNDQHFIYGSDLQSIYEIISQGSEKGMPGWKHILSVDQLRALAIFTKHLSTPLP